MRLIIKNGNGSYQLERSNLKPPSTSKEATSRWKGFSKNKKDVEISLVQEQYGLCAYTEIRPDEFDLGTHIEHIEPKSLNPRRTFDYSNLVLSALSSDDLKKLDKDECFGGHSKLSEYNESLFISCLQDGCASFFVYLSNGSVEPARTLTKEKIGKVQYTIDLLNLNSAYLVNKRKNWLDELDFLIDENIQNNGSLEQLASIELTPVSGLLSSFFTASRQRLGKIAERVLSNDAPELV